MATTKRLDEPTPAGGDYSEIVFMDERWNVVDEAVASRCVIRECKADGSLLQETLGVVGPVPHGGTKA